MVAGEVPHFYSSSRHQGKECRMTWQDTKFYSASGKESKVAGEALSSVTGTGNINSSHLDESGRRIQTWLKVRM